MVQRSATMAFAAGALVFPGGAVDVDDHALAASLPHDLPLDEATSRIAAIRETLEESGIAPGLDVHDAGALSELRLALAAGTPFSALIRSNGLSLNLDALTPFARWHPNAAESARRIFDARFYLARFEPGGPEASVDDTEHVDLFWATARDVLARCDAGQGRVIFPTRRNLERLAQFDSTLTIESDARAHPVERIVPWIEERPDGQFLCIPDTLGYPVCEERLETVLRG